MISIHAKKQDLNLWLHLGDWRTESGIYIQNRLSLLGKNKSSCDVTLIQQEYCDYHCNHHHHHNKKQQLE
jgi:hypothetical protein